MRAGRRRGGGGRRLAARSRTRACPSRLAVADEPTSAPRSSTARRDFRGAQRLIGLGGARRRSWRCWAAGPLAARAPLRERSSPRGPPSPARRGRGRGAAISLVARVAGLPLGAIGARARPRLRARDPGLGPWLADRARSAAIAAAPRRDRRVRGDGPDPPAGAALVGRRHAAWSSPTRSSSPGSRRSCWRRSSTTSSSCRRGPDPRARACELGREAGVDIGEVYRVDASRRSTALNAYVDGLGSTKRVVIYDNADPRAEHPAELRLGRRPRARPRRGATTSWRGHRVRRARRPARGALRAAAELEPGAAAAATTRARPAALPALALSRGARGPGAGRSRQPALAPASRRAPTPSRSS